MPRKVPVSIGPPGTTASRSTDGTLEIASRPPPGGDLEILGARSAHDAEGRTSVNRSLTDSYEAVGPVPSSVEASCPAPLLALVGLLFRLLLLGRRLPVLALTSCRLTSRACP